jgi:hypothetical protein
MKTTNAANNPFLRFTIVLGLAAIFGLNSSHAQETVTSIQLGTDLLSATNVMEAIEANLPAIEATATISADSVPFLGNFYSAQCTNWPPLPGNVLNLPIWDLGDGYYVLDDLDVNYTALAAKAAKLNGGRRPGPMFQSSFTLPQGLILTPPAFTNGNVSVSISGQDPSVPYDIYYTTNLAPTIQWALVSHGVVGQTNYVFANSFGGSPTVFFIVGSGADTDGDGLTDGYEALVSHTNPFNADTDGDGMSDGWEIAHGLNPLVSDLPYTPPATTLIITKPSNHAVIQ